MLKKPSGTRFSSRERLLEHWFSSAMPGDMRLKLEFVELAVTHERSPPK